MDPVRDATVGAIRRILDPLLEVAFDAGITVAQLNQIVREQAVLSATRRVKKALGRLNKSRVAITTGLSRGEVSRILAYVAASVRHTAIEQPARRVLAAWHDDHRFLDKSGEPAVLPIFGRRRTFEKLLERYGAGIPVRAMLDELVQLNAVETMSNQCVRAKTRIPVATGFTPNAITELGEKARYLLESLIHNLRTDLPPLFEATAQTEIANKSMLGLVRRHVSEQGSTFITNAHSFLNRLELKPRHSIESSEGIRVGVTIFYFQNASGCDPPVQSPQRRNLKRSSQSQLGAAQNPVRKKANDSKKEG